MALGKVIHRCMLITTIGISFSVGGAPSNLSACYWRAILLNLYQHGINYFIIAGSNVYLFFSRLYRPQQVAGGFLMFNVCVYQNFEFKLLYSLFYNIFSVVSPYLSWSATVSILPAMPTALPVTPRRPTVHPQVTRSFFKNPPRAHVHHFCLVFSDWNSQVFVSSNAEGGIAKCSRKEKWTQREGV